MRSWRMHGIYPKEMANDDPLSSVPRHAWYVSAVSNQVLSQQEQDEVLGHARTNRSISAPGEDGYKLRYKLRVA